MATTEVASLAPNLIQETLTNLDAEKTLITTCSQLLNDLTDHFSSLEQTLADRSHSLSSTIDAFDADNLHSISALESRESSIPERESAALAQIEEIKNSTISEMADPDLKLPEDLPGLLRLYCRRMDSAGLWRFVLSRRKDLGDLRKEIPDAVAGAVDPVRLVLDSVEDFLNSEGGGDRFWALGMLLRALLDRDGKKTPEVSESLKEKAGNIAEVFKMKLDEKGEGVGGPEAQMFLQLVVVFGLSSKFEQEFLRKMVMEHASRKEMSKLVAGLGFGEKLPDIIDELVKTGKVIEAVYFSHESGLTEQFPPIPLLTAYLKSSKKNVLDILKKGNYSTAATQESTTVELAAIRSIIYCVEALNIEKDFSLVALRKRLSTLEKAKADRKSAPKFDNKRARPVAASGSSFRAAKSFRTSSTSHASFHRGKPPARQTYNAVPPQYYGGPSVAYGGFDYVTPAHSAPAQSAYPR